MCRKALAFGEEDRICLLKKYYNMSSLKNEFELVITNLQELTDEYKGYDLYIICSDKEDKKKYMDMLSEFDIKIDIIIFMNDICNYLSKAEIMNFYKEEIRLLWHQKIDKNNKLSERGFCKIEIGDYTYGLPIIYDWGKECTLTIGKFCSIAPGVQIMAGGGNHHIDWITTFPFNGCMDNHFRNIQNEVQTDGNIEIGNDVWIGGNSKILSGVHIGDGSIIAANAVVTKSIPPYTIWGGVPARKIRNRFDEKYVKMLLEMQWWNWENEEIYNAVNILEDSNIDKLYDYYIKNVQVTK